MTDSPISLVPEHVAIIMDGNGRWAKSKMRPRVFGHYAGRKSVDKIIQASAALGVKTLSLFAFSSENWARPPKEVSLIMELIKNSLGEEAQRMYEGGIRLRIIGDRTLLSDELNTEIDNVEALTSSCHKMQVILAINYSGRWAIIEAAKQLARKAIAGEIVIDEIDEKAFEQARATPHLPPVDLLIRSSGEMRISNFHLWELAYAELYFTDTYWPDFDREDLEKAFATYRQRNRRFGGLS